MQQGAGNTEAAAGRQRGGKRQRGGAAAKQDQNVQPTDATQAQGQGARRGRGGKRQKQQEGQDAAAAQTTGADQSAATATASPNAKEARRQARQERKNARKGKGAKAETTTDATGAAATGAGAAAAGTSATVAPNQQAGQANVAGKGGKRKLEQQKVQQIKQQHANFRAQPKPERAPAVTFNQNYRIQNAERWQGPRYEVFRSYRPEWHDSHWYHSRFQRVELIAGGYYYFNNGYWFPAWGYSPQHQYYAYDGPIYVGQRAVPPDQVIADVQAALQEMGYYRGEVDGLVGPLTREALAAYQADEGLTPTAAIDEPTLESLGMA